MPARRPTIGCVFCLPILAKRITVTRRNHSGMEPTMRYTELAERSRSHQHQLPSNFDGPATLYQCQPFRHAHTSLGFAGHLVHMSAMLFSGIGCGTDYGRR